MTDHPAAGTATAAAPTPEDLRFKGQVYLQSDVARLVGIPRATLRNWVHGYRYRAAGARRLASPLVVPPADGRWLSFTNLVECHTLAAFRSCGVSMQQIRPAVSYLGEQLGMDHPLASRNLQTDGAEVFFRFIKEQGDDQLVALLNVSRSGQIVFEGIVEEHLARLDWADDGFAEQLWPAGREEGLVIDPRRGFGQVIVARKGVRVESVAARLAAGEDPASVAGDFGLSSEDVAAVARFEERLYLHAA